MSKKEIERKFDEILAFAELEKFIETPVKHYSSGMYVRLAFAVAAHLEPEILLVDEVLAVGDVNFQKKCLGKMGDVARKGRTVVLVSHQLNQIRRLCERVVWIDGGVIRKDGNVHDVVSAYQLAMARGEIGKEPAQRKVTKGRFVSWKIANSSGGNCHSLVHFGDVTITFTIDVDEPISRGHHGIAMYTSDRTLIWATTHSQIQLDVGTHQLSHAFSFLPVRPGPYSWAVSLSEDGDLIDYWDSVPEMLVATENHQHQEDRWNGILNVPSRFFVDGDSKHG
jgi:homopolymeric O-antigen transport system ATP-binding protein